MALTNTPLKHPISKNMKHLFHEWWRVVLQSVHWGLPHHPWSFSITHGASPSLMKLLHHSPHQDTVTMCLVHIHTHILKSIRKKKILVTWIFHFEAAKGVRDLGFHKAKSLNSTKPNLPGPGIQWNSWPGGHMKDSCGVEAAKCFHSEVLSK